MTDPDNDFWKQALAGHLISLDEILDSIRYAAFEGEWERAKVCADQAKNTVEAAEMADRYIAESP